MEDQKPQQEELQFPDPEEFPSYDEVDSEEGQAELPEDSFDASQAGNENDEEVGCCVR